MTRRRILIAVLFVATVVSTGCEARTKGYLGQFLPGPCAGVAVCDSKSLRVHGSESIGVGVVADPDTYVEDRDRPGIITGSRVIGVPDDGRNDVPLHCRLANPSIDADRCD